jgi:hypothetical protein
MDSLDKVTCQICLKQMSYINNRHLSNHGITAQQYKEQFPNHSMKTDAVSSKLTKRSIASNSTRKGRSRSQEEKDRIRAGIKKSFENGREAHNKGVRGVVKASDQTREKLSVAQTKSHQENPRIVSEDTRQKISTALTGRTHSPESYQNAVQTKRDNGFNFSFRKGIVLSKETKNKISKTLLENKTKNRVSSRAYMLDRIVESSLVLLNEISDDVFRLRCDICEYEFTRSPQMFHNCRFHTKICDQCHPTSKISNAENDLAEFISQNIYSGPMLRSDYEIISPLELDIVLPELKIAIEYCGLYWHSELAGKTRWYHRSKLELCEKAGYRLITVFEDEWVNKRPIVESMLRNVLGKTNQRVFARKCEVRELDDVTEFLNENHIQGRGRSSVKYGLFHEGELISVMTFICGEVSRKVSGWDMNRFATKIGYNVVGGASKLFKAFVKGYQPGVVISYADLRWGTGNVYGHVGFVNAGNTVPNYWYFKTNDIVRRHRFGLRKQAHEPKDVTEADLRYSEGWNRIWDCGHAKWVWTSPE